MSDEAQCNKSKCGEYNMLRCCRAKNHPGECCYVIDRENDYPHNRAAELAKTTNTGGRS